MLKKQAGWFPILKMKNTFWIRLGLHCLPRWVSSYWTCITQCDKMTINCCLRNILCWASNKSLNDMWGFIWEFTKKKIQCNCISSMKLFFFKLTFPTQHLNGNSQFYEMFYLKSMSSVFEQNSSFCTFTCYPAEQPTLPFDKGFVLPTGLL